MTRLRHEASPGGWIVKQSIAVQIGVGLGAVMTALGILQMIRLEILHSASQGVQTFGVLLLVYKVIDGNDRAGVSLKSQELTVLYLLIRVYSSLASGIALLAPIVLGTLASTACLVYLLRERSSTSAVVEDSNLPILLTVAVCSLLSAFVQPGTAGHLTRIPHIFSFYLEAVSLLPQLRHIMQSKGVEPFTIYYLVALGLSRMLSLAWGISLVLRGNDLNGLGPTMALVTELVHAAILVSVCFVHVKRSSDFDAQKQFGASVHWATNTVKDGYRRQFEIPSVGKENLPKVLNSGKYISDDDEFEDESSLDEDDLSFRDDDIENEACRISHGALSSRSRASQSGQMAAPAAPGSLRFPSSSMYIKAAQGPSPSNPQGSTSECNIERNRSVTLENTVQLDPVPDTEGSEVKSEDTEGRGDVTEASAPDESPLAQSEMARNRWKQLKYTVKFVNQMSRMPTGSAVDILDESMQTVSVEPDSKAEETVPQASSNASKKSTKVAPKPPVSFKAKGRKGLEGLQVKQERTYLTFFDDFYVACLKMPSLHFLAGVFSAPLLLGVAFLPLFLLDVQGLTFEQGVIDDSMEPACTPGMARRTASVILNVFLYALSLSTTFGGSPVAARSPYTLLVANLNTLMAQFLFVFLSGAVFARMSQPAHPVRCSQKAIIRSNDYTADTLQTSGKKLHKIFAMRMVLTGPHPCELVDVKICLTFRIFLTLPNGSIFCSTNDLPLVRNEVSYLKYGQTVRHIIDEKSPLFSQTKESLLEGDASFSVTVVGMERSSMQSIFHMQDYFVHDGDVVWDVDYQDFVHINEKGQRVIDHSKIDLIKVFKVGGVVGKAISKFNHIGKERGHLRADSPGKEGDDEHSKEAGGVQKNIWRHAVQRAEEAAGTAASALSKLGIWKEKKVFVSKADSLTRVVPPYSPVPLSPVPSFASHT